ncbi:MAG: hypothetical protein RSD06_03035 [Bacilli bacterium]
MDKQKVAVIGAGGAGNKMLEALMEIDDRYTPVFCNTNIREMENLDYYDAGNNALYFANAQGTGRDRDRAKEAIKKEQSKTIDFFANRFSPNSGIDTFFIVSSSDGGTGSGSVPMLATVIKNINPEASVNLLIAMCSLNEREASLKNTKALWNDIIKLMKNNRINSVQFIDNNKMVDEEEFNVATMKEFDEGMSVNNEEIDSVDSSKVNTAKGYKAILTLDPRYNRDIDKAIRNAKDNSNFIMPDTLDCDFLMATFDPERYDKNTFKNKIKVFELDKYDYNEEERNTIVLGGLIMPKDYIELIDIELEELMKKKKDRDILSDDLMVEEEVAVSSTPKKKSKTMTKKQLKELMNDDSFWD